jgi:acyl-CoA thioester hydrolase
MGFVHHSVYAMYFEEARTEGLRALGVRYKDLEDNGIIMPVRNINHQNLFALAWWNSLLI